MTTYVYDAFGRTLAELWDGESDTATGQSETLRFGYDQDGQIVYAENSHGTLGGATSSRSFLHYDYASDPLRRLASTTSVLITGSSLESLNQKTTTAYHYDTVGNDLEEIVVGTGDIATSYSIEYTYDSLGRLASQEQSGGTGVNTVSAEFMWNAAGQLQWMQRQKGTAAADRLDTFYGYDSTGRIKSLRHETPGPTSAALPTAGGNYNYLYDGIDRLISKEFLPGGSSTTEVDNFFYDAGNQLVAADHNSQDNEDYTYDVNGNRTQTNNGVTYGAPDDYNRLSTVGDLEYSYDNEGGLTRRMNLADDYYSNYAWDHRHRLASVSDFDDDHDLRQKATYVYDAFNRRVAKLIDSDGDLGSDPLVVATYAYDGNDVLFERNGAGTVTHHYSNGPLIDQVLADDKHNTTGGSGGTAQVRWLLGDEQQSIRQMTQTGGTSIATITYDSFGKITSTTTPASIDLLVGYTGQVFDGETGLNYYKARYYDASVGKFLSEDPIISGPNSYAYVGNNPMNFTDSSGMSPFDWGPNHADSGSGFGGGGGGSGWGGIGIGIGFFADDYSGYSRGSTQTIRVEAPKPVLGTSTLNFSSVGNVTAATSQGSPEVIIEVIGQPGNSANTSKKITRGGLVEFLRDKPNQPASWTAASHEYRVAKHLYAIAAAQRMHSNFGLRHFGIDPGRPIEERFANGGHGWMPFTTAFERMQDNFLFMAWGVTRDEAVVELIKFSIRATGQEVEYPDEWYLNQPGRWVYDSAVGEASDPTNWVTGGAFAVTKVRQAFGALSGTFGVAKSGKAFEAFSDLHTGSQVLEFESDLLHARTLLGEFAELRAQRQLMEMTGNTKNAHYLGNHSPLVSNQQLWNRATKGIEPWSSELKINKKGKGRFG